MAQNRTFLPLALAQAPFYVGVDLGGTNIKVGVVDDQGRTLSWVTTPTHPEDGPEEGARRMGESVLAAIHKAGLAPESIARVGLGTPGTMDIPAGMLLDPPNLPGWDNFPIRDRVSHHCRLPITYSNDANAAAYGEFWIGSGRSLRSMVMFTLGTGIGCGIIVNNQTIDGENSHGGECGHVIIDMNEDARLCECGGSGHLEAYASATGVIKRMQELLDQGQTTSVARRVAAGEELTPLLIAQEAEKGDSLSHQIIDGTARYMAVGIVTLMHTIDPQGVVLGGAMTFGGGKSELGQRFLNNIRAEVHRRALPVLAERTTIQFAELGGDAGYIGAAGVARAAYRAGRN